MTDDVKQIFAEKEKKMKAILASLQRKATKESILEATIIYGSEERLNPFRGKALNLDWTFEELLDLLCSADIPTAQKNFKNFYKLLEQKAPKPKWGRRKRLTLYRGTSQESLEKHGAGYFWTPDQDLALKFANHCCSKRYTLFFQTVDRTPIVLQSIVPVEQVLFSHINDRGEKEVFLKKDYLDKISYLVYSKANGGLSY